MSSYELFLDQIPGVCAQFQNLHEALTDDGKVTLQGEIDIVDQTGKFWESYQVEIHHEEGFPHRFPRVFEAGGKLPRIGDWHIYEDTLSCCIAVLPQELIKCRNGISLLNFIKNEMIPYFFNQTHRRVEGFYKNGEYSHGLKGVFEFYDEILNTNGDVRKAVTLMIGIANSRRPARTHECFCGSGEKFRKCHRDAYDKLLLLTRDHLRLFAYKLAEDGGYADLCEYIKRQ